MYEVSACLVGSVVCGIDRCMMVVLCVMVVLLGMMVVLLCRSRGPGWLLKDVLCMMVGVLGMRWVVLWWC